MRGRLYLVPNLLGLVPPEAVLPARTLDVARGLRHFVVENAKPARQFLKSIGTATPLQQIDIAEMGAAPTAQRCVELLAPVRAGHDLGVLSDAGCPGIADPGALLVAAAHAEGIAVTPLVGPSSILLALMASGMNGQGFTFHGYLPAKTEARIAAIGRIETESRRTGHAQLFIETPYRNAALLEALAATCRPATRLCVAADLTLATESVVSQSIAVWRGTDFAPYAKRPSLYVLQA
jgi:16S rRNA (cytidine1402-2'-O)-methyltransferase